MRHIRAECSSCFIFFSLKLFVKQRRGLHNVKGYCLRKRGHCLAARNSKTFRAGERQGRQKDIKFSTKKSAPEWRNRLSDSQCAQSCLFELLEPVLYPSVAPSHCRPAGGDRVGVRFSFFL